MDLAPNIYVARIDRRSVVLDLNRDRYIGLNAALTHALYSLYSPHRDGSQLQPEGQAIAKLLDRGILTSQGQVEAACSSNPSAISQANIVEPAQSLWALLSDERTSDEPISYARMISALISLTEVAVSLRLRSFKTTIDWLAKTRTAEPHRQASGRAETLGEIQALVDAFDEVRPYFPLKPVCRLDAPSLCLHLRRNGQNAQLVFGVRLDPFAAHCWVQIGQVAISEAWAILRQYTPILVV